MKTFSLVQLHRAIPSNRRSAQYRKGDAAVTFAVSGATAVPEGIRISESDAPTASRESNYPIEWCSQRNAPCG